MPFVNIQHEALTFEDAEGKRIQVKLSTLMGDAERDEAPDGLGLLIWVMIFQLVELNHRLGSYQPADPTADPPVPAEGQGMMGLMAQAAVSLLEVSRKTGQTAQAMADIQQRASGAQLPDPAKFVAQAMGIAQDMMSGKPGEAKVERPHGPVTP